MIHVVKMVIPISVFFGGIKNWKILTRKIKLVEFTLETKKFKNFPIILSKKCEIWLEKNIDLRKKM